MRQEILRVPSELQALVGQVLNVENWHRAQALLLGHLVHSRPSVQYELGFIDYKNILSFKLSYLNILRW